MMIAEVAAVEGGMQIGGGAGYVTDRIRDARINARAALDALGMAGNKIPVIGPHPREAALAAAREAVIHLQEALDVEAPEDAIVDTRHALEELVGTINQLERMGNAMPLIPGELPLGRFERAIDLLIDAEHKLTRPEERIGLMNDNGGIVPPWMQ